MRFIKELTNLRKLVDKNCPNEIIETPEDKAERELCEENFYEFIKHGWHTIEGDREFVSGWHIVALALHLELTLSKINFLIINVPPGYMKTLVALFFNAYVWTKDPSKKFMHLSYSLRLSAKHNSIFRKIITSSWYQKHWGKKFKIIKDNESEVALSTPGHRISSSVESRFVTGMHFDFILLDDPNSAADVHTKSVTDRVNEWYDQTLMSRLLPGAVRIIIQQRFNDFDLTGHVKSKGTKNVVQLRLPEKFIPERRCETIEIDGVMWKDPRTQKDELLWPQFKTAEIVAATRAETSERIYAGQYQQEPMVIDGEYFLKKHFNTYNKEFMPDFKYIIQSWDTALKIGDNNCYSACTTWGIFEDDKGVGNIALLSTFRAKITTAQLYDVARNMAYDYYNDTLGAQFKVDPNRKPNLVLVEDKINGVGLIEDLSRSGINVKPFNPKGSKEWRAMRASILLENGKVWLLAKPGGNLYSFSQEFLDMAVSWPNNKDGTDLIDTMTQALIFIMEYSDVMPTTFLAHKKFVEFRQPNA